MATTEEKRPGLIRRIGSGLMRLISTLRLIVSNLLFLLVLVLIVVMFRGEELPAIAAKGALVINPQGTLVDQLSYTDALTQVMGESSGNEEILLQDIIDAIDYARDDKRITSIVLELDGLVYAGISKMQEIAVALERFRSTGKRVIAVGDNYSQDQYWLAAQADEVYIHPMGSVLLQGYGLYRNYYKQALDKLDVTVHVFRVGEYKSAMEPFMRDDMSEAARTQSLGWLNSLWSEYTAEVSQRRGIQMVNIDSYINELDVLLVQHQGDAAAAAVSARLVDGIKNRDEANRYLVEVVGAADDEGHYQSVSFAQYIWLQKRKEQLQSSERVVGVVVASGMIVDGEQPAGMIGGDTLAGLVRQARQDENVRALVLRVDSGGGSAFASEVIRQELMLLQQAGKPLVVSMGSMAASGGYWIAASADQIWATPSTLTGSIGIFGAFPTLDKTLERVGITTDGVGTTALAGALRVDRPLEPVAERVIQSTIEHGYRQFIDVVANGRSMSRADVEVIAQGRVWSGVDAQRLGLVDELGGLEGAINAAAELAGIDEFKHELIEVPLTPQELLLRQLTTVFELQPNAFLGGQLQRWLAPFSKSVAFLSSLNDPRGIYAHCTGCIAP